jgi:uncharacterized protein YggT (Ycf19 family)
VDNGKLTVVRVARAIVWFVYAVVVLELVLLTFAFFLRLFGASTEAEFTQWVYRSVDRAMQPFRGIFPAEEIGEASVLDFSLLFAMIVYSIFALALHALLSWLTYQVRRLNQPVPVPVQPQFAAPGPHVPSTSVPPIPSVPITTPPAAPNPEP